jgi:elongation factor P
VSLSINEIKSGVTILVDGIVYVVVDAQHVKPGKGAAFVRAKARNMKNSNIQEITFRGDAKIDEAFVEERKLQYQYRSADMYHFMDTETYEDIPISEDSLSDNTKKFLKDNLEVAGNFYKGETLTVSLPNFIEFNIIHTEPGIKGDTEKSGTKPAEVDTGAIVQVPLFVNEGDKIKLDTRTGGYVERVA